MYSTANELRAAVETATLAKATCERLVKEYARIDGTVPMPIVSWGLDGETLIIVVVTSLGMEPIRMPVSYVEMPELQLRAELRARLAKAWIKTSKMTRSVAK